MIPDEVIDRAYWLFDDAADAGMRIFGHAFLAWPLWCFDIEIEVRAGRERNELVAELQNLHAEGFEVETIACITGMDRSFLEALLADNAGSTRTTTLYVDSVFCDAVRGTIQTEYVPGIRAIRRMPTHDPQFVRGHPVGTIPRAADFPLELVSDILVNKDKAASRPSPRVVEVEQVLAVRPSVQRPLQYVLVCFVHFSSDASSEWRSFNYFAEQPFSLSDDDWTLLRTQYFRTHQLDPPTLGGTS